MAPAGKHLTVACKQCGKNYRQAKSSQLYCSRACSQKAWRAAHPGTRGGKSVYKSDTKLNTTATCERCGASYVRVRPLQRFCSRVCQQQAEAERRRKARSDGPGKGWSKGMTYVDRQTCQRCGKEFYAPPVLMRRGGGKFCSNDCRTADLAVHPERYPQVSGRKNKIGKRADLNGQFFRSAWEANWARYLNWLIRIGEIQSWEYEVDTFEFTRIKRGQRFYTPDFKVKNGDGSIEYHEVKGWMDPKSRTKLDRMRRYYPAVKVVLIDQDAYKAIARQFSRSLPEWE